MAQLQKHPLRVLSEQEEHELQRIVKATSERQDVIRRAKALLAVAAGQPFTQAAHEANLKSGDGVGKLVKRFNTHGLAALLIAPGRGGKPKYASEQKARILAEVQRVPDRLEDQTATWSLLLLRDALRKTALPHIAKETIRQVLHEHGYSFQRTRTWCRTGYALRKRKSGTVTVYDPQTLEKKDSIPLAYEQAEAAGIVQRECQMKQALIRRFRSLVHPGNRKATPSCNRMSTNGEAPPNCSPSFTQPPATCVPRASSRRPTLCCIPGSKNSSARYGASIEKKHPRAELPPEAERPACARWETWLGHPPRNPEPPLRIVLVLDNLAGHLSYDLVKWFFEHGVMPLYTPIGGSWLNMAESVQRIIVPRALNGQHPKNAQEIIDWLEQTVAGWNEHPTPFVWNGKRRQRRERARLRRLAGSGAALVKGYSIVS